MPFKMGAVFALVLTALCPAFGGPVNYTLRNFGVPTHVVTVDLSSPYVSVRAQVAAGGIGTTESFHSMLRRTRPVAAVTGTFFDPKTKLPIGDIAVDGQLICRGMIGDGICFTKGGQLEIVSRADGVANNWQNYDAVVCGGPTLLMDGQWALYPRDQGFRDPALFAKRPRTAVGHTYNNKMVLVSVNRPIHLRTLGKIMQKLGCKDAVSLDGGSSTGLWFNGRILSEPARRLTNVVAVHINNPLRGQVASGPVSRS
ncbi:MAG: phosphodiester glycosidase family protein [Armatimonadetes bacterium]|nr:phosphodiester glycosidase family protein [Armatimonadota bacterium]